MQPASSRNKCLDKVCIPALGAEIRRKKNKSKYVGMLKHITFSISVGFRSVDKGINISDLHTYLFHFCLK